MYQINLVKVSYVFGSLIRSTSLCKMDPVYGLSVCILRHIARICEGRR